MGISINRHGVLDVSIYKVDIKKLPKKEAAKSNMTMDEFLKARQDSIDKQNDSFELSDEYMEHDLYLTATDFDAASGTQNNFDKPAVYIFDMENSLTDPQFIDNFAVKESFYKDEITSKYSGDELTQKLKEFDEISNKVLNKLADSFANGIGDFMNGNLNWLYEKMEPMKPEEKVNNGFDVKAFKSRVIQVVKDRENAFENIKANNPDKWQDVIKSSGSGISAFKDALDSDADAKSGSDNIDDMSYKDMVISGTIIHNLGGGIYTNSAETLGAYLGQMKLKGDMMLGMFNISENVGERLETALNSNIAAKIDSFGSVYNHLWGTPKDGLDKDVIGAYSLFANLSKASAKDFKTLYSEGIHNVLNVLLKPTGYNGGDSPYSNQVRYANDTALNLIQDWNNFINNLNMNQTMKSYYYMKGYSGNNIDSKS